MSSTNSQGTLDALLRRALVVDHIYDAILVTGEDESVVDWNAGAERMFGWTREEVMGRPLGEVHRSGGNGTTAASIFSAVARDGRWQGELQFTHRDGGSGRCEAV